MGDNFKGWTETTVGDFSPFLYGKGLAERQRNQLGSVPVFGSNGVIGTHTEALVNNAGIVIGRKGTVGAVHFCKGPFWPIDTAFYVESKPDREIRYIYYLLRSLGLEHMNADSAVPGLNRVAAHSRKILIPPLTEQKAIASILGALDDKIELNRKMNESLEAMARALFKSWFVDFDPIPGFPPHKEWQNSSLGKIPKGWRVGTLGELCEIVMGQSPPGETYNESGEGLPFYQGIRDFGFRFPSRRIYCTASTRLAQKGDVLLSVRAPVGSLNVAGEDCAIGRGVAALRIKGQHYGFLYYLMKETQEDWKKFEAEGTVFGSVTKTDVQNFSIIIPQTEVILRFNEVVFPMDETIKNNEMQSLTLASIRDTLLPKLLSGEIRVKDAERFVEGKI
ncbi:MAG: hypothetical protein A2W75_00580 [Nitrospinae bacterium RIFCSPLOWO2_12_39_15]|nr:MAG: hypothetical protein A2W75_00580 [Nitrospinae bacterium RIFCSPLOWO2_12_39_15]